MSTTDHTSTGRLATARPARNSVKENSAMFLEEALARSRMREAEQAAAQFRQVRTLTAGRMWSRLSRWSARRADRAARHSR
jgi:hypothetical protein